MNYLLMQILAYLLVANLIGLTIGWLISRHKHKKESFRSDNQWYQKISNEKDKYEKKIKLLTEQLKENANVKSQKVVSKTEVSEKKPDLSQLSKLETLYNELKSKSTKKEFQLNMEIAKTSEIEEQYQHQIKKLSKEVSILKKKLHENLHTHKDNLQEINNINPELEKKLNKLGIYQFKQIAKWSEKQINWIDNHLSLNNKVKQEKWIEQAQKKRV